MRTHVVSTPPNRWTPEMFTPLFSGGLDNSLAGVNITAWF